MQVSVETTEGLGRRMKVQVPAEHVDNEVEKRLRDLGARMKVDGFRPGKVPLKVVRQRHGGEVRGEVLNEMVQRSYAEALQQQSIRPAAAPHIEPVQVDEGEDLEYVATFDVMPEIEIQGIEAIRVRRPAVEITDADVDNVLERLRKQHAEYQEAAQPAVRGDRVVIDFEGTIDGQPFEGNQAEDAGLILGVGQLPDAFEEGLVGASAGDELTVTHTFPEGLADAEIAGQTAEFKVRVKRVEAPAYPEIDGEFARRLGLEEGGVEALRQAVRGNLERERDNAVRERMKQQVMDQLAEANDPDLPASMVDAEIHALREYAKARGQEEGEAGEYEASARRRVKLGLLVNELVRREGIQVDQERMVEILRGMSAASEDPREMFKQYTRNRQLMESVEASVLEDQVVEWVLERAQTEDEPLSFEALVGPSAASPEAG